MLEWISTQNIATKFVGKFLNHFQYKLTFVNLLSEDNRFFDYVYVDRPLRSTNTSAYMIKFAHKYRGLWNSGEEKLLFARVSRALRRQLSCIEECP